MGATGPGYTTVGPQRCHRERYKVYPFKVVFGLEPETPLAVLVAHKEGDWTVEPLYPARVPAQVNERVSTQEQPHQ